MDSCNHVWVIDLEQGVTLLLRCERCSAFVGVEIGELQQGGHSFALGALRGRVSDADFAALADWCSRRYAPRDRYRVDVNLRALRRRRSLARAA